MKHLFNQKLILALVVFTLIFTLYVSKKNKITYNKKGFYGTILYTDTVTDSDSDTDRDDPVFNQEYEKEKLPNLNDLITFVILRQDKSLELQKLFSQDFESERILKEFKPDLNLIVLDYQRDSDWYRQNIKTPYSIFIEDGFQYLEIVHDQDTDRKMLLFLTKSGEKVFFRNLIDIMHYNKKIDVLAFDSYYPFTIQRPFKDYKNRKHIEIVHKDEIPHYYPQNDCKTFKKGKAWPKTCDLLTSSFILRTSAISKSLGNWKPYLVQNYKQDFFFKVNKNKLRLVYYSHLSFQKKNLINSVIYKGNSHKPSPPSKIIDSYFTIQKAIKKKVSIKKRLKLHQSGIVYMGVSHQRNGHLWVGCRNHTFRCDFNYLFRGTNLPPCCVRKMAILLNNVEEILTKYNIPHFLDRGTLLSLYREKVRIPWDTDEDISMLQKHWIKYKQVITDELNARGFEIDGNRGCKISWSKMNKNYIDLYRYTLEEDKTKPYIGFDDIKVRHGILKKRYFRHDFPSEMIFPTKTSLFFNHTHQIPKKSIEYIELLFGKDWETEQRFYRTHQALKCPVYPHKTVEPVC